MAILYSGVFIGTSPMWPESWGDQITKVTALSKVLLYRAYFHFCTTCTKCLYTGFYYNSLMISLGRNQFRCVLGCVLILLYISTHRTYMLSASSYSIISGSCWYHYRIKTWYTRIKVYVTGRHCRALWTPKTTNCHNIIPVCLSLTPVNCMLVTFYIWRGGVGESRLSATHDHTTICKMNSVVYAYVCECRCGALSSTCLVWAEWSMHDSFLGAKLPTQSCYRWAERSHLNHYTDFKPASRLLNSLVPSVKLRSTNLQIFTLLVWRGRGLSPGLPQPSRRSNPQATCTCTWGFLYMENVLEWNSMEKRFKECVYM